MLQNEERCSALTAVKLEPGRTTDSSKLVRRPGCSGEVRHFSIERARLLDAIIPAVSSPARVLRAKIPGSYSPRFRTQGSQVLPHLHPTWGRRLCRLQLGAAEKANLKPHEEWRAALRAQRRALAEAWVQTDPEGDEPSADGRRLRADGALAAHATAALATAPAARPRACLRGRLAAHEDRARLNAVSAHRGAHQELRLALHAKARLRLAAPLPMLKDRLSACAPQEELLRAGFTLAVRGHPVPTGGFLGRSPAVVGAKEAAPDGSEGNGAPESWSFNECDAVAGQNLGPADLGGVAFLPVEAARKLFPDGHLVETEGAA